MPRRKRKVNNTPIEVGDYVKIGLSGMGSEAYVVEEIHYKENKNGEMEVSNYTIVDTEIGINGKYTHRIGENGTCFASGTKGFKSNLRTKLQKLSDIKKKKRKKK